ncbi:PIR protein CIR protein [Plasmodium vinckei]|uniref:PIR protein CIR protein n=1 Tax=Plasmodium vinckei TaxID=5860 RepID=A0A6V7TI44_PLAVN|nr:PIR protein CIR protein [Plasmodium vinckei]
MANYNLKNAYYDIYMINDYFGENNKGQLTVNKKYKPIHNYCYIGNNSGFGNYRNYLEMTSCSVIYLLKTLKDKYNLEYDKLAEYAILWLSYKLSRSQKNKPAKLNDFYTNYILKNNHYNEKIKGGDSLTYMEIINKKKDLMNIKEISKFNIPFYILFYLNYVFHDEYLDRTGNSNLAKRFAKEFEELSKDSKNIEESLYNKILSTLSDDYNKLKNIYGNKKSCNLVSLPEIEPKKKPSENPAENSGKDSLDNSGKSVAQNIIGNSGESPVESSANGSEQILGQTLEVTSSSSSILNTLIPSLSIVSVIPVFLGIAYKTIYKKKIKKNKEEHEN